jgi:aspartokinase
MPATGETVVMKFGGTSVAAAEDIKRAAGRIVAAREDGKRVVAVLSARGQTTDDLVGMAREVSDTPAAREMDMLLSTGERISCALCAMAIHDLGHNAISLTGSQAGIVTDSSHTKARILDVRADRIRQALGDDRIVLVAGFQGVSGDSRDITTLGRGGSDTTAVAIAAALDAPIRAWCPMRACCGWSRSRRCSRWRPRAPRCSSFARSSTRATTRSRSTAAVPSRRAPVLSSSPRRRRWKDPS